MGDDEKKRSNAKKEQVLAFLDAHFSAGDYEQSPIERGVMFTNDRWFEIHKMYLENCDTLGITDPVGYDYFTHIR